MYKELFEYAPEKEIITEYLNAICNHFIVKELNSKYAKKIVVLFDIPELGSAPLIVSQRIILVNAAKLLEVCTNHINYAKESYKEDSGSNLKEKEAEFQDYVKKLQAAFSESPVKESDLLEIFKTKKIAYDVTNIDEGVATQQAEYNICKKFKEKEIPVFMYQYQKVLLDNRKNMHELLQEFSGKTHSEISHLSTPYFVNALTSFTDDDFNKASGIRLEREDLDTLAQTIFAMGDYDNIRRTEFIDGMSGYSLTQSNGLWSYVVKGNQ